MKVTTERLEDCVINLVIEVEEETLQPALQKAARQASTRFNIPGFRKGKAPYDMVLRLVGKEYLLQEALDEMAPDLVTQAIEEQELEPYSRPQLTNLETDPLRLTVSVPLEPEVELGDYREVHLEREPAEVPEEDIQKAMQDMRRERAVREPIERPLQVGDTVTGRLTLELEDGETKEDEEAVITIPTPEEESLPGLSEHLVGATVGDVVEFDTVFAADHRDPELAGKPAHVTVEIAETEEQVLPELNDEFAVMLGDYDDLESLKAELKERLEAAAKQRSEDSLRRRAVEALVEGAAVMKYPAVAVEEEMDRLVAAFFERLTSARISKNAYLQAMQISEDQFREQQRQTAEKNLKEGLALRAFVKAENIQATPEELTARIERTANQMGATNSSIDSVIRSPEFRLRMANNLVLSRAMSRLVSVLTGEPEPPEEELPLEDMPAPTVNVVETTEGEDEAAAEGASVPETSSEEE